MGLYAANNDAYETNKSYNKINRNDKENFVKFLSNGNKTSNEQELKAVKNNSFEPNASVYDNMAPALTEPLSPANLSAASTKKENKFDETSLTITRERRKIPILKTSITTRKGTLRLKAVTAAAQNKLTVRKKDNAVDEQMGLSAALNNNNNRKNKNETAVAAVETTVAVENTENTEKEATTQLAKSDSTQQLLADLTDDFGEAISAEISLRKQFLNANLSSKSTSREIKDILVIKGGESNTTKAASLEPHMESQDKEETQRESSQIIEEEEVEVVTSKPVEESVTQTAEKQNDEQQAKTQHETEGDGERETPEAGRGTESVEKTKTEFETKADTETATATATDSKAESTTAPKSVPTTATAISELIDKDEIEVETACSSTSVSPVSKKGSSSSSLHNTSMEELPPVNTDSTMTASEVEDNLEERLSQLESLSQTQIGHFEDVAVNSTPKKGTFAIQPISSANPPKTPTQQSTQAQFLQSLAHTQLHILQTPPSTTQGSISNSVTPTSSTSMMKDAGAELVEDQDLEEVLKALKGFDGTTGADGLCDLNVLFNEVYTSLNYDDINSQSTTTAASSASALITPLKDMQLQIEKKQYSMQRKIDFLLRRMRKVQARYMCKHTTEEIGGIFEWTARIIGKGRSHDAATKPNAAASIIAARPPASTWANERRKPLPALNHVALMLHRIETIANSQQMCTTNVGCGNLLTANTHLRKTKKGFDGFGSNTAGGTAAAGPANQTNDKLLPIIPQLDVNVAEELVQVTGLLQTEMREVQTAIDSDATASSSGGESADEMVTYGNHHQESLSIAKRAAWRFSRDRAAVASRWSWLLSQISDLEIKIRQHSDLHQEIIKKKGAITCDAEYLTQKNTGSISSPQSSSVNGYKGDTSISAAALKETDDMEEFQGCCRTRGFNNTQFRKRKLLQTTNLHTISKKAARPSNIKCGCQWPLHPCALCTGRTDPTAPRDMPDTMIMSERVALLDPGFHPVLSFPEDISTSLHFEAIARLPEWQQRVMRAQVKSIAKSVWKAERDATGVNASTNQHNNTRKFGETMIKRRYTKKKIRVNNNGRGGNTTSTPNSTGGLSNDTKNGTGNISAPTTPLVADRTPMRDVKGMHCHLVGDGVLLEPHSPASSSYIHQTSDCPSTSNDQYNPNLIHSSLISNNNNNSRNNKNRKLSSASINSHHTNHSQNYYNNSNTDNFDSTWDNGYTTRSRTSSPTHFGSGGHHYRQERSIERRNRSSYDIDNIVIPYSVAASTRVEILPYKEIPTPKWRVINGDDDNDQSDDGGGSFLDGKNTSITNQLSELTDLQPPLPTPCLNGFIETPAKELCSPKLKIHEISDEKTAHEFKDPADIKSCNDDVPPVKEKVSQEKLEENNKDAVINNTQNSNIDDDFDSIKGVAIEITEPPVSIILKNEDRLRKKEIENIKKSESTSTIVSIKEKNDVISEEEPAQKKVKCSVDITKQRVEQLLANIIPTVQEKIHAQLSVNASSSLSSPASSSLKKIETTNILATVEDKRRRSIPNGTISNDRSLTTVNIYSSNDSAELLEEDISDDAIFLRHERALHEERRKFQTYLKFPWSTRSRANRRIDSRNESSGANTPDPASPAPQTPSVNGGDHESIPSPLAPSTPLNPMETITEMTEGTAATTTAFSSTPAAHQIHPTSTFSCLSNKRNERRRTTSIKKERELERRSNSPEFVCPPYEPLKFPLSEKQYESMLQIMPSNFQPYDSEENEDCSYSASSRKNSKNYTQIKPINATKQTEATSSTITTTTTIINSCDPNQKSYLLKNASMENTDIAGGGIDGDNLFSEPTYTNGSKEHLDEMLAEESDDSPKHYLAPNDDDLYDEDAFAAYAGDGGVADTDGESSETEPFQDDDPNDPEWRGERRRERSERSRRKL